MKLRQMSQYAALMARLAHAEELLESLQNASRPGVAVNNGMPRSSEVKDKVGNLIVEIADLKERIAYLKREMEREKKKLHGFIDKVPDERTRTALRLKFMYNITWGQTAEIMGASYTEESVKKLCYKYLSDS